MSEDQRSAEYYVRYFKVTPCPKRQQHDWTCCFNAHPGEKARRRDLQTHSYAAIMCADMLHKGSCDRGDACPMAHNVFEYHMHPDKYRTKLCTSGSSCQRSFCFFAHSQKELRRPAAENGCHSPPSHQLAETMPSPSISCVASSCSDKEVASHADISATSNGSGLRQQTYLSLPDLACISFTAGSLGINSTSCRSSFDTAAMPMAVSPLSTVSSSSTTGVPVPAASLSPAGTAAGSTTVDPSCMQLGAFQQQKVARLLCMDIDELQATAIAASQELAKLKLELQRKKQEEAIAAGIAASLPAPHNNNTLQNLLSALQQTTDPADAATTTALLQAAGLMSATNGITGCTLNSGISTAAQYGLANGHYASYPAALGMHGCASLSPLLTRTPVQPQLVAAAVGPACVPSSSSITFASPAQQQQQVLVGPANIGVASMLPTPTDALLQQLEQQLQLNLAAAGGMVPHLEMATTNTVGWCPNGQSAYDMNPAYMDVVGACVASDAAQGTVSSAIREYSYFG